MDLIKIRGFFRSRIRKKPGSGSGEGGGGNYLVKSETTINSKTDFQIKNFVRRFAEITDCKGLPPKMQPDTNEDSFHGRCVMYAPLSNGHRMRLLYKTSQLEEFIYPDLKRSL